MSKIKKLAREIAKENSLILERIKEEKQFVVEIYRTIIDDLDYIKRKAISNNATTILSDLGEYVEELRDLAAIRVNDRFRGHILMLVSRIELIKKEYKLGSFGGGISLQDRIVTITNSLSGAINSTILIDLKELLAELGQLERKFERAA